MEDAEDFDWQTFDKRVTPLIKRPEVTIQSKGILSLNASAYHLLGRPEAVELLWDQGRLVIGLRAVPAESAHAYPIRGVGPKKQESGTFLVSGRAFFAYYRIPLVAPVKRDVRMVKDVLILDLKDPGRDATSNRNRGRLEDAYSEPTDPAQSGAEIVNGQDRDGTAIPSRTPEGTPSG